MNLNKNNRRNKMKKNLIFKLCFIVGIFLIILTACDLGTKQWANITFNLEGPAIEQARANSGASSSSRYIHPNASSLKFELFSGKELLDSQTISINKEKNISITIQDVPLNDPNLRAEIEVRGNQTSSGPSLLGQNTIHLGRIGLGYTKLTLGVKPAGNFETVKYKKNPTEKIELVESDSGQIFGIQMYPEKGLYTIEAYESGLELYASDGRVYKNTHPIPGKKGTTLVFYHPENKASTYYLASSSGNSISGAKLDQDILVTQYDENDEYDEILDNLMPVKFKTVSGNSDVTSETLSFTIYNPYSYALSFTTKFKNETVTPITGGEPFESKNNFKTNSFPHSLPPGKSQKFEIIFEPEKNGNFSADFTIQAEGLGNFVLELSGSGSGL
jgi:hypothetical protein